MKRFFDTLTVQTNKFILLPVALSLIASIGMPAEAFGAGSASIRGTVMLEGTVPKPKKIKMGADPVCQKAHTDPVFKEGILSQDSKLQNVVVYIKEGLSGSFPAPSAPVVLIQEGCVYKPHVFLLQTGQPLEIVNDDATLHNVNCKPKHNKRFNIAQPIKGMKTKKKFANPETGVRFKCNVHPWMTAFAVVLDHPFGNVTGADGTFQLNELPAGTYTIEAWHETLGAQTQSLTIADGESKELSFSFKIK